MVTHERLSGRGRMPLLGLIASFAAGSVISALLQSIPLAIVAWMLQSIVAMPVRLGLFLALLLILGAADMSVGGLRPVTLRRQTNPDLYRVLGPAPAWFMWGIDLGLGWTTIRATGFYWVLTLFALMLTPPRLVWSGYLSYVMALCLTLVLGMTPRPVWRDGSDLSAWLIARSTPATRIAGGATVSLGLAVLSAGLFS